MEDAQVWIEKGIDFIMVFGPKIIGAILIYIIGSWVIKKLVGVARKGMTKQEYDESLKKFLLSLVKWALKDHFLTLQAVFCLLFLNLIRLEI